MIQASYTFDLFDSHKGTLLIDYNMFDVPAEEFHLPAEMVKRQIETRVRNIICDQVEKMRNQRAQNYRFGDFWDANKSRALFAIPTMVTTARPMADMIKFASYVNSEIRPLLSVITPEKHSRFYPRFVVRLSQLDDYLKEIKEKPDFADILSVAKKPGFPL